MWGYTVKEHEHLGFQTMYDAYADACERYGIEHPEDTLSGVNAFTYDYDNQPTVSEDSP